MKTCLTIVPYRLDNNEINNLLDSSNDILAITMPVMSQLDSLGISYLNSKDFINQQENFIHLEEFSYDFFEFLKVCDEISEKEFKLKKLFSSNGYSFFHRISHLMFLQMLMDKIEEKYNHIILYSRMKSWNISDKRYGNKRDSFSSLHNTLIFDDFYGVDGFVKCFITGFESNKLTINQIDSGRKIMSLFGYPLKIFIKKLPSLLIRKFLKTINKSKTTQNISDGLFWATDISYDVEIIKKINPAFEILLKRDYLIEKANKANRLDINKLRSEIVEISQDFFSTSLSRFRPIIVDLFDGYTSNIVSKIPSVQNTLIKEIKLNPPDSILFPSGISNILEYSLLTAASSLKIPIFSFKHTGIESVFFKPQLLDKFRDYNQDFKRNQFVHIQEEKKIFRSSERVNAIVLGNLKTEQKKNIIPSQDRRIIYSAGITDTKCFHGHYCNLSDVERHLWTDRLINVIQSLNLSLDIKLHPVGWQDEWEYYSEMIASNNKTTKLIAGGSIEDQLKNYDLVVLDMIPTQTLSSALSLGMNIIIFKQNEFLYNPETFQDIEERVYFVNNKEELMSKLVAFKKGTLVNKGSESFSSKYLISNPRIVDILRSHN